uniref:Uncharacterized protein n=1 Tax=Arundo donax TaxID=35708 RepID=A0A0A9B3L5_ARUDO
MKESAGDGRVDSRSGVGGHRGGGENEIWTWRRMTSVAA